MITATIFAMVFLPWYMPAESFDVSIDEIEFFTNLGRDVDGVSKTANAAYKLIFNDTGVAQVIDHFYHNNDKAENTRAGIVKAVDWARKWMDNFTRMVYRGMWRLIALWPIYMAGLATFCVPAMIDGLVTRAKKRYDFLQSNPIFFYGAAHAIAFAFGLGFFIPFIPLPIDTLMIAGFTTVVALSLRVAAANFQTGQ